jgi:hypothetical protein
MATSREINKPNQTTVYYIYVSTAKKITIQPKKVYVKGSWYNIASFKTVKTDLVPVKNTKVNQLELGAPLQKSSSSSELIISYSWKGHTYKTSLKKITVLPSKRAE